MEEGGKRNGRPREMTKRNGGRREKYIKNSHFDTKRCVYLNYQAK